MSDFFEHPRGFDVGVVIGAARDRDRVEILQAIDQLPAGRPHVLALAPDLAQVLSQDPLRLPVVGDRELVSFSWELRPAY
ncbi:MAG: hypothetical protein U0229_19490 [Anaeromyxobacter sp.]